MTVPPPLTRRELATVLAALAFYSEQSDIPASVYEIATDAGPDNPPSTADTIADRLIEDTDFTELLSSIAAIRHADIFTIATDFKDSVDEALRKLTRLANIVDTPGPRKRPPATGPQLYHLGASTPVILDADDETPNCMTWGEFLDANVESPFSEEEWSQMRGALERGETYTGYGYVGCTFKISISAEAST